MLQIFNFFYKNNICVIITAKCGDYMLLFRALNDYDIASCPLKNGIASKKMMYDLVRSYYENMQNMM